MGSSWVVAGVDRPLLDGVLGVSRDLGGCVELDETLQVIADAVVDVLGFGAAAVNVVTPGGDLRVDAVAGPSGLRMLLGNRTPLTWWLELLDCAEAWGALRFFSHARDQAVVDRYPSWVPAGPFGSEPDAWHPQDSLLAPLWDSEHALVGVISVDDPRTGRLPSPEQQSVLEAFAAQAAKAIRDAQARQAGDDARGELETRWQLAFEQSPTGAALVGVDGHILQANDALAILLGYSRTQLATMRFADITHPGDVGADQTLFAELLNGSRDTYTMEKRYLRKDTTIVHAVLRVGAIRDAHGRVHTIIGQLADLTERKRREHEQAHQRTHDELTGLLNHAGITAKLAHQLTLGHSAAVLFCDIDRFKIINNSLGRATGDEVLIAAARTLVQCVNDGGSSVARVGNDEFVVLAPSGAGSAELGLLGAQLIDAFRQPLLLPAHRRHTISISIGATVSDRTRRHADELITEAQEAMFRAKQRGRARVETYDPHLDHPGTPRELELDQALRAALDTDDQFTVYLQPIVNVADETVVGFEALTRWQHPHRGVLEPAEFLPVAEHSGLIVDLGWRMLTLGTRAAAAHNKSSHSGAWVAINVSGHQLGRGKLPTAVSNALATSGLRQADLHLEFTETALVDASTQAIDEIHEIADMGISIALDDFGTGYSSLSLLRDLPISVVKIDRSFTTRITDNRRAAALVRSLVSMCDALNITTIAEGIETRDQLALIRALGCDEAQGYLFGKPAALAELGRLRQ